MPTLNWWARFELSAAHRMLFRSLLPPDSLDDLHTQGRNPEAKANASLLLLHPAAPLGPFNDGGAGSCFELLADATEASSIEAESDYLKIVSAGAFPFTN
ncbi:hypothetical protein NST08_10745 [Paenibacillus sp. FSL K6-1566]|uniref:Uncharacterized protein n=1 Tax=Paenibacillus lactis TaxID=228574 RepID=A0ABS4F9L5_9BACL|nr:hypothetical protein [Paenibacillus lactis]MBP1892943.1 hypothetical protein [Paenibacillus lactis]MCM3495256.1 hypothetical protein [Paenibacillus lactis]